MLFNQRVTKHPRGLWVISIGKLWNTFGYFGTQTILVLYLMHVFNFSQKDSYLLYGAFAALTYSMPIFGGILADKWLSSERVLILGSIFNIIGNVLLMFFNHYLFCLGLATAILGSGLYRSTSTHLVGELYALKDIKKEAGFTWLYLAINVGGMLAPIIFGLCVNKFGWQYGFLVNAIGILISTLWFVRFQKKNLIEKKNKPHPTFFKLIFIYSFLLLLCFILSIPFYFLATTNSFILSLIGGSIFYLGYAITRYNKSDRMRLWFLFLLFVCTIFYFAVGLQIGSSITLFIAYEIKKNALIITWPASTFSALYPLFVLCLAPLFSWLWRILQRNHISINVIIKVALGILFAFSGILTFAIISLTHFVISGIFLGILFLSAGELMITPAIYTAISDLTPLGMKNTMMGGWSLFVAAGGYLSSVLANTSAQLARSYFPLAAPFFYQFLFIALFTLSILLMILLSYKNLANMLNNEFK